MKIKTLLTIAASLLIPLTAIHAVEVQDLRCEVHINPLTIDAAKPGLSWKLETGNLKPERGIKQSAYQILVASSPEILAKDQGDLWDSGKVESAQSVHVGYSGKPLASGMLCHWKVKAWTTDGEEKATEWSAPAFWRMGALQAADWCGKWISHDDENLNIAPWMRKSFDLAAVPSRAFVTVNIAGYAELYINGQKVGTDVLTPAVSDNTKQVFYNTYDVTSLLKPGRNTIGLWVGQGIATRQESSEFGGVVPAVPHVRAQIEAEINGNPWALGTDASWKTSSSSYQRRGGTKWGDFGGERIDPAAHIANWSSPDFDDKDWKNAVEVEAPKGEVLPKTTQHAVEFIKSRKDAKQPFFLYFAYPSPHAPIIPNKEFIGKSGLGSYGDHVVETDHSVGQILGALKEAGLDDNTLVIFSSDNGAEHYAYERDEKYGHWSSHPLRGLKRDIYEGGHRLPFLVKWPGVVPPNSVCSALVSQIDLMATLAAVVGAPLPNNAAEDSHNLLPLFQGGTTPVRESHVHNTTATYAIRHGDWVLVDAKDGYISKVDPNWKTRHGYPAEDSQPAELYNLKEDIGQKKNLAAAHPEKLEELRSLLKKIQQQGYSAPRLEGVPSIPN